MAAKTVRATIVQTAPSGADHDVSIRCEDKVSGITFIEIQMTVEQFGKMLHAPTLADCTVILRGTDKLGWAHESKVEHVVAPYSVKNADKDEILAPFEVDGWRARRSDLGNGHRRRGNGFAVVFTRLVPPAEERET